MSQSPHPFDPSSVDEQIDALLSEDSSSLDAHLIQDLSRTSKEHAQILQRVRDRLGAPYTAIKEDSTHDPGLLDSSVRPVIVLPVSLNKKKKRPSRLWINLSVASVLFLLLGSSFLYMFRYGAFTNPLTPTSTVTPNPTSSQGGFLYEVYGETIYQISLKTGEIGWHFTLTPLPIVPLNSDNVIVAGDTVYIVASSYKYSSLYALEISTGNLRWNKQIDNSGEAQLMVTHDIVLLQFFSEENVYTGKNNIYGISLDGEVLWTQYIHSKFSPLQEDGNVIYLWSKDKIIVVDWAHGNVLGELLASTINGPLITISSVKLIDNKLYVETDEHYLSTWPSYLRIYQLQDQQFKLQGSRIGPIQDMWVIDNTVFIVNIQNVISIIDANAHEKLIVDAHYSGSLQIIEYAENKLYILQKQSNNMLLLVLDGGNGKQLWSQEIQTNTSSTEIFIYQQKLYISPKIIKDPATVEIRDLQNQGALVTEPTITLTVYYGDKMLNLFFFSAG